MSTKNETEIQYVIKTYGNLLYRTAYSLGMKTTKRHGWRIRYKIYQRR